LVVTYPVEGHFEHDHADRCGDVTDTLQMALMCADPRLQDIVVVHVDMAASARVKGNIPRRPFGETDLRPQHTRTIFSDEICGWKNTPST